MKIMLTRDKKAVSTKWVCNFASELANLGYAVDLVYDDYDPKEKAVPLDSKVNIINLTTNNLQKILHYFSIPSFRFKKLIDDRKPDVVICYFMKDLFNVAFLQNHKMPIVMMMHNPPKEVFEKLFRNPIKKLVIQKLIKKISLFQVLMNSFKKDILEDYPNSKVVVIPNQVVQPNLTKSTDDETKQIIHVAQIAEYNKRQHLLIKAFAQIAPDFPDWKVAFYGKAKKGKHTLYYKKCLEMIKDLGLEKQVFFKGFSTNVTQDYLNSDINTLPSRSEGFGYGLADGLALGIPSIGFADAAAINEIIIDKKTGFLVADVEDYADKLKLLMSDKNLRQKMGQAAHEDMARYSPENVMNMWDDLIKSLKDNK